MAATSRAEPGTSSMSLMGSGAHGLGPSAAFPMHKQGAGREVEPMPMWDAGAASAGLVCYVTVPARRFNFVLFLLLFF